MRWVKVFAEPELAREKVSENKPQLLVVDGTRICLVKRENRIYAVADRCPHNGESLSKGMINFAGEIVCPWHGHQFNLKTGRELQERSQDLECYPVKEEKGGLYLGI